MGKITPHNGTSGSLTKAELAGFWLAEGWRKNASELTLTNNCPQLIWGSYLAIKELFGVEKFRIYAYLPHKEFELKVNLPRVKRRIYVDKRASKPYFMLRLGNKEILNEWKSMVSRICMEEKEYAGILRGFFAGEGNIHATGKQRSIRIAQKEPVEFVDRILAYYGVSSVFCSNGRSYVIFGRKNWEVLARVRIADLHPDKKEKFWHAYNGFKEWHYKHNHILDNIFPYLDKPRTSKDIAEHFKRSRARIQDILIELKKRGRAMCYKPSARGSYFWVDAASGQIPVCANKAKILSVLERPKRVYEISLETGINNDAVRKNLRMLNGFGFIKREGKYWVKLETEKEAIVCE